MDKLQTTLTLLGTGHALVTECFNTCYLIESGDSRLLIDTGGGNYLLHQLKTADIDVAGIHDLFITHAHTDHLLGAPWLLRAVSGQVKKGRYRGRLNIYSHAKVLRLLHVFIDELFSKKDKAVMAECLNFIEVKPEVELSFGQFRLTPFDILSTKELQYGFRLNLPDGKVLVCLGDEPFNEHCRPFAMNADLLLSEAYCLKAQAETFKPYEKNHSTAFDAGVMAADLKAKALLLYHTEDSDLEHRRERYSAEAAQNFKGQIFVPRDLERVIL